ncbi:MAG: HEAT repeat domain-containing protein [Planctomycetaceae bacterium]|nr:HEAT repeat domain-containing protein [Planctomycetaceae bacterium]MCA9018816.1 HEAT repeat domain-containing protein [Planctomycetaceae bacterium]
MLANILKPILSFLLISSLLLAPGCGGSDTSQQRTNSNPFAPANNNNVAPAPRLAPASPRLSQSQPAANPVETAAEKDPSTPTMQSKTGTPANETPETDLLSEIRKQTLDAKQPGVAIIIRGLSDIEPDAVQQLQKNMQSAYLNSTEQKDQSTSEQTENAKIDYFSRDQQLVLVLHQVPKDLFAFAQKLNCGKMKEIDVQNRIITIEVQPEELNALAIKNKSNSLQSDPSVKVSANSSSLKSMADSTTPKPETKPKTSADPNRNDRDLKPRPDEDTIDWALRVISGTSSFTHDLACKKLVTMKPDTENLARVSTVLAETLPQAQDGFRMKEHINAMSVWYTDEATLAFAKLLEEENSALEREKIIQLMPTIHSETMAEILVGRLPNRADMKDARTALKIMGTIAEKPVLRLLDDPDKDMRIEACNILQAIGTQKSIDALKKRIEVEELKVVKLQLEKTQEEIEKKLAAAQK